jgi:ATP-binding cassette subfamily F protein 3
MQLRGVLGCFLFSGDEVFKKIKVLSGGEKSRVALAKTLISSSNFLLLDEPTNHLDMMSVNILIQALQQYEGTFVVISHDRHFIANIANKIWYIEDKEIKQYPGTYDEFVYWLESNGRSIQTLDNQPKKDKKEKPSTPTPVSESEKENKQKQLKKTHKELAEVEQQINQLEKKAKGFEGELALPSVYSNPTKLAEVTTQYNDVKKQLSAANTRWEVLVNEIERLEN